MTSDTLPSQAPTAQAGLRPGPLWLLRARAPKPRRHMVGRAVLALQASVLRTAADSVYPGIDETFTLEAVRVADACTTCRALIETRAHAAEQQLGLFRADRLVEVPVLSSAATARPDAGWVVLARFDSLVPHSTLTRFAEAQVLLAFDDEREAHSFAAAVACAWRAHLGLDTDDRTDVATIDDVSDRWPDLGHRGLHLDSDRQVLRYGGMTIPITWGRVMQILRKVEVLAVGCDHPTASAPRALSA